MTRAWTLSSLLVALAAVVSPAQAGESRSLELKVISYNVQFLPGPARFVNVRGQNEYRAKKLAEQLAGYDVIGFNEVFDDQPREMILAGLKSTWGDAYHAVAGPKPTNPKRYNGGLAVVAKLPIVESHSIIYDKTSLVKDHGFLADEFASKGALHARLRRSPSAAPDDFLDVFVTHLEARDSKLRPSQITQLSEFIRKYAQTNRPTLVMGDFNTRADKGTEPKPNSPYQFLLTTLRSSLPTIHDVWPVAGRGPSGTNEQTGETGGHRIDYIFFAAPPSDRELFEPIEARVNRFLDPKTVALSDHSAVEAEFRWRPTSK